MEPRDWDLRVSRRQRLAYLTDAVAAERHRDRWWLRDHPQRTTFVRRIGRYELEQELLVGEPHASPPTHVVVRRMTGEPGRLLLSMPRADVDHWSEHDALAAWSFAAAVRTEVIAAQRRTEAEA